MYSFGRTSKERLYTCHPDIVKILEEAIQLSSVDFGVAEGHRSIALQNKYFIEGKSETDGLRKKGKHNYVPSLAVDVYAWVNGKAMWDVPHLSYIAGVIQTVATIMLQNGEIRHRLRWGGNWDMDGEIITDQTFIDCPHFELV